MRARPSLRSRSSRPSAHGKCSVRLDTPLPESVLQDFEAVAHLMEKSAATLNRQIIEDFLYGKVKAVRIAVSGRNDDGNNVG